MIGHSAQCLCYPQRFVGRQWPATAASAEAFDKVDERHHALIRIAYRVAAGSAPVRPRRWEWPLRHENKIGTFNSDCQARTKPLQRLSGWGSEVAANAGGRMLGYCGATANIGDTRLVSPNAQPDEWRRRQVVSNRHNRSLKECR